MSIIHIFFLGGNEPIQCLISLIFDLGVFSKIDGEVRWVGHRDVSSMSIPLTSNTSHVDAPNKVRLGGNGTRNFQGNL